MKKLFIAATILIVAGYIAYRALQLAGKASPVHIGAGQTCKDGTYIGSPADAIYGNIQIRMILFGEMT